MDLYIILGILIIVSGGLGVYLFGVRPKQIAEKNRNKTSQAKRLKTRAYEIFDVLECVSNYQDSIEVRQTIHDYYSHILRELLNHDSSEQVEEMIAEAESMSDLIKQSKPIKKKFDSNSEMADTKQLFAKAAKIIQIQNNKGRLAGTVAQAQYKHIIKTGVMLEVETLLAKGDQVAGNGDPMAAQSFYKKAQQILLTKGGNFEGKPQKIRQISNKIKQVLGRAVDEKDEQVSNKNEDTSLDHVPGVRKSPTKLESGYDSEIAQYDEHGFPLDPKQQYTKKSLDDD